MGRKDKANPTNAKPKWNRKKLMHSGQKVTFHTFISKQRFLKLSTIFMFLLVLVFTAVTFVVFVISGSEPSTLVSGFFDFVKWEFAGLTFIKVSENIGTGNITFKKSKLQNIASNSADILDSTADLVREVSTIDEIIEPSSDN